MSAALSERAPAKINLTLRVLGRRADGYHELESLVAFATASDIVRFQPGADDGLEVAGQFAAQSGASADNLVLKALGELRRRVQRLKGGSFYLEKNLPVAAGLGGGSADAAAALRLLARVNNIALTDERLMAAARAVGADVTVCLDPRPRIMRGVGEQLSEPLEIPMVPAVLVNPAVAVATRDVFARFSVPGGGAPLAAVPPDFDGLIGCLQQSGNDLTGPAIGCAPAIGTVLDVLASLPGCLLARMSGSGATCFAVFASLDAATVMANKLESSHTNWWIRATTIGSGTVQS